MKTISIISALILITYISTAQVDRVLVYGSPNNQSVDLFVSSVELPKVRLDEKSNKLILTPREMSRIAGHCNKVSQDTTNGTNGQKIVTEEYELELVVGSTTLSKVVAEVSYEFPVIKFGTEPVFGLKILNDLGLTYTLSGNSLTLEKPTTTWSVSTSSLCPNAKDKGVWYSTSTHHAEIKLIACSVDPKILEARDAVQKGIEEYGGSKLSIEAKVPPPQKAVDRVAEGVTVRFFDAANEQEASILREFLAAMCNAIDVSVEDMRPYYPNGIADYMEVWIK
jgi:hypothetical protein